MIRYEDLKDGQYFTIQADLSYIIPRGYIKLDSKRYIRLRYYSNEKDEVLNVEDNFKVYI